MQVSSLRHRIGAVDAVAAAAALLGAVALANHLFARRTERRYPPQGRFVEVDGVRLHYLEAGSGPPVILLHGNGTMAEDFAISGVLSRLAARHRVIAFDRPGFGHTMRTDDRSWSAAAQAALILKARARLDIENPIVLAHSWGTLVALEMALSEPRHVAGLVLVSGYYIPTLRVDAALMAAPAMPILGTLMRYTVSPLLGWILSPIVFRKLFAPAPVTAAFKRQFKTAMALRPSQIRANAADTALMVPGAVALAKRYGDLALPMTFLGAPGDKIVDTQTHAVGMHQKLRDSELRLVHGAGHMLHHTDPGQVVRAVEDLAESHPGTSQDPVRAHA